MNRRSPSLTVAMLAAVAALLASEGSNAQPPARRPVQTGQAAATVDLTGDWVSVVTEDWKFRMLTPNKGVFDGLPLNAEGRRVGDTWDPKQDAANGEQCRAYGAANIMRMPGRLRIKWEGNDTLRIDTDAGEQTRLSRFGPPVSLASRRGRARHTLNGTGRPVRLLPGRAGRSKR